MLIGYVGHHTGWSFPTGEAATEPPKKSGPLMVPADAAQSAMKVTFQTPEAIRKSGITTVKSVRQSASDLVFANGVLDYDQRQLTRILSRVSGTFWQVERYRGDSVRGGDVLAIIEAPDVRMKADFLTALAEAETNTENLSNLEKIGSSVPERQIRQARLLLKTSRVRLLNAEQTLVNVGLGVRMEPPSMGS